jgi:hypothetical protein
MCENVIAMQCWISMLNILVNLSVDESFGLVRAVKTLMSCGIKAESMHVNSFRNSIAVRVHELEKLNCITRIKGFASVELRYVARCDSNAKGVLKKLDFSLVPLGPQRIVGYRVSESFTIVVKKTSTPNTYLVTVCNIKSLSVPLPSSACVHSVVHSEDVEKLVRLGRVLAELGKTLEDLCKSTSS